MKKSSRSQRFAEWKERPMITVGLDLGDRFSHYCRLNQDGEVMEEGRVRTSEEALRRHFEGETSAAYRDGMWNSFALDQPSAAEFGPSGDRGQRAQAAGDQ